MLDTKSLGLTEQVNETTGRLELHGKTDLGEDYIALNCRGKEVTLEEEKFLALSDREKSNPSDLVNYFVGEREEFKRKQEEDFDREMMDAADIIGRAADTNLGISRAASGIILALGPGSGEVRRPAVRSYVFDENEGFVITKERIY